MPDSGNTYFLVNVKGGTVVDLDLGSSPTDKTTNVGRQSTVMTAGSSRTLTMVATLPSTATQKTTSE